MKQNKGFTLVELIIVIAILAIIMLIAIPNFSGIQQRMQVRADKATAAQIGKAVRVWFTDCSTDDGLIAGATSSKAAGTNASGDYVSGDYVPGKIPTRNDTGLTDDPENANNFELAPLSYENLVGIEEYISLQQYPTSLKVSDTNSAGEATQYYGVFLTDGYTASSAKLVVAIAASDATNGNNTVSVPKTGTFEADYDGLGSGIAYVEP